MNSTGRGEIVSVLRVKSAVSDTLRSNALHPAFGGLNDCEGDPADRDFLFRHKAVFVLCHIEKPLSFLGRFSRSINDPVNVPNSLL